MKEYQIGSSICYPEAKIVVLDSYDDTKVKLKRIIEERSSFDESFLALKPLNSFISNKVGIFVTSECQLKCIYCYYDSDSVSHQKGFVISLPQIDFIVGKVFESARIISIAGNSRKKVEVTISGGGEPTLHWDVFHHLVTKLRETAIETDTDLEIELVTNGIVSADKIDFILKNINSVTLSYDGTPDYQTSQRIGLELQHDMIMSFLRKMSDKCFNFAVRATVLPPFEGKLLEICDYLFSNFSGVNQIILEPVSYTGRAEILEKKCHDYDYYLEYCKAYEYVNKFFPQKSISCSLFPNNLNPSICSAWLGRTPWIDSEGYVMPCNERMSHEEYAIGRIGRRGGFDWYDVNRPNLTPISKSSFSECNDCLAFYFCRGGCPIVFKRDKAGKLCNSSGKNSCRMVKQYWEDVFCHISNLEEFMGFVPNVLAYNSITKKPSVIEIKAKETTSYEK